MTIIRLIQIVLFVFLLNISISLSLYEDQIGKFDWRQKYVGKVKFSHIDLKSKLKRIFVATESNVLACLSFKSGTIIWRQVLEIGPEGTIMDFHFNGAEIVTLSGNGPFLVRGWNPNSGTLLYEWVLSTDEKDAGLYIHSGFLYQVKLIKRGAEVSSWDLKTGHYLKSETYTTPLEEYKCIVWSGKLSCISLSAGEGKGAMLDLNSLDLVSGAWAKWRTGKGLEEVVPGEWSMEGLVGGGLLLHLSGPAPLALVLAPLHSPSDTFTLFPVKETPLGRRKYSLTLHMRKTVLQILDFTERGEYSLSGRVLNEEGSTPLNELSGHFEGPLLTEASVSDFSCTNVDTKITCFTLLSGEDHSSVFMSPARVIWTREEALASVVAVEMLDLPISDVEAAIEKEFASKEGGLVGMFLRRLVSQMGQLETAVEWALGGGKAPTSRGGARADLVKDTFGLHKLIIAVTSPAKIFGIDNNNGEIVWQRIVEGVEPHQVLGAPKVPLFVQRSARVQPLPAQWTLIFKEKDSKNSVLFVFNPINGQPLAGERGLIHLGYRVIQASLLPSADHDFIKGLLLLGPQPEAQEEQPSLSVFPESSREVALLAAKTLFLYTLDPSDDVMKGYTLAYSNSKDGLLATEVWRLRLGSGGSVVGVVGKPPGERVHSQGRVLGDRSVLYKYVNPNLVAVAVRTHDPVHKSILSVHLVDTVSGRVLFSVSHKRVSEPFHLVHSENWVVYSYFNDKFRRTELVSLELYEGKTQANTTAFSSLTQRISPFVERQAYIFPHHIMAMRETITEKGITSKHVLVGLGSGGIMEVPWMLLDPRRSSVAGAGGGMEDGVVPYIPELALPTEAIVSYNQTLANIAGIHTSPAGLESTCLVFAYGLDLFYTRVSPSKTFDVLKDDFEYWLITAVLCGLTVAAYVTKKLASRKALRQAWK